MLFVSKHSQNAVASKCSVHAATEVRFPKWQYSIELMGCGGESTAAWLGVYSLANPHPGRSSHQPVGDVLDLTTASQEQWGEASIGTGAEAVLAGLKMTRGI